MPSENAVPPALTPATAVPVAVNPAPARFFEEVPRAPDAEAPEAEVVLLNMEAALRVYTPAHLFAWTQGALQHLIRHEVLLCALRKGEHGLSHVESLSTAGVEPEVFAQGYRQAPRFGETLIRDWEENFFHPVSRELEAGSVLADCELGQQWLALGVARVLAHGLHDAEGRMSSFFIFACRADAGGAAELHRLALIVPFLHAAWLRTKVSLVAGKRLDAAKPQGRDLLTQREQEVLHWVCLGKSNIEIGMILGISALTVKNHVQEILRRLNVQNRAQAVGKAYSLHILTT